MNGDKKPDWAHGNEGIQATNVTAEVLAVGRGATAYKRTSGESQDLSKVIGELRAALDALPLQPGAKDVIEADVKNLESVASSNQPEPDRGATVLQSLAGKLKMVGVVLADTVALAEPIRKIAGLLSIPLHMLGM